jgi:hypothetical protein
LPKYYRERNGPTRSRMAAHCVLDGPIRTNCLSTAVREMGPCEGVGQPRQPHPASCTRCGPTRRSPVAAHCMVNGPIRTNCPNTLMHAMGPHDGVVRAAAHGVIDGPIRTNCPNTLMHAMGPFDGLVRQPIVCLMSQFKLIA